MELKHKLKFLALLRLCLLIELYGIETRMDDPCCPHPLHLLIELYGIETTKTGHLFLFRPSFNRTIWN